MGVQNKSTPKGENGGLKNQQVPKKTADKVTKQPTKVVQATKRKPKAKKEKQKQKQLVAKLPSNRPLASRLAGCHVSRQRTGVDLRRRTIARCMAITYLEKLSETSQVARQHLQMLVKGECSAQLVKGRKQGAIALTSFIRDEQGSSLAPLVNPHYNHSAAIELEQMSEHRMHVPRQEVKRLEKEMVKEELETNAVGQMYLASLLDPCGAANPGVPDEENRALSMKLRVRTVYLLPMTGDQAYVRVSRNPAKHIQIIGDASAMTYDGPILEAQRINAGSTNWSDQAGRVFGTNDTFVGSNAEPRFWVGSTAEYPSDAFINNGDESDTLDYEHFRWEESGGEFSHKMIPMAPADVVRIRGWTTDVTPNNYAVFCEFAIVNGGINSRSRVYSSTVTGTGETDQYSFSQPVVAPANTVGILSYGIQNQGTVGTTTIRNKIQARIELAAGDLIYPIGSADLQDIGVLMDYAQDVRPVGLRVTVTYVAKKLEGGYIVGGQLPQLGDELFPSGDLAHLAVIPGMRPRPLNGMEPGISFPVLPMSKGESDYADIDHLYDKDDYGEGAVFINTTGADANLIILQTEMSLQARTERQTLMATTGEVDLKALAEVQTYLAEEGPLSFVTGNDDHQQRTAQAENSFQSSHPTFSFFNGWFTGNDVDAHVTAV